MMETHTGIEQLPALFVPIPNICRFTFIQIQSE